MIRAGQVCAFYLFDVSESLDLTRLTELLHVRTEPARLAPKPAIPSYLKYQVPPLHVDGGAIGMSDLGGLRIRLKFFDYGVVSLSLTQPYTGPWDDLIRLAHELTSESTLEPAAERVCRQLVDRIRPALARPRDRFLSEDYFVFSISELDEPAAADAWLARNAGPIAQLLRAEIEPLSDQERDEVLRYRLSYLANDVVVPTWSTALVYDTDAGIQAVLAIFEYANSQLLQFR